MTPTTYRATDFLKAAKRAGVEIVVGTNVAQVLGDLAPAYNLTIPFDDSKTALRIVRNFTQLHPIDTVVGVDDEATVIAAAIANALHIRHNSVGATSATRNKARMRELCSKAGLPSPSYVLCTGAADLEKVIKKVRFPSVAKPLSLSASRGVIRANDPSELKSALSRIEKLLADPEVEQRSQGLGGKRILVEEFIPGEEVALEGLLIEGELHVLALFDKPDPLNGPFFEETLYVTPSRKSKSLQQSIFYSAQKGAQALGLIDGPIHGEFRINDKGVWILEIAARTIGGLCSRTLRFGTGMSLEEVVLRHAARLELPTLEREKSASGVMMIPIPKAGVLQKVEGIDNAKGVPYIEEVTISIPIGQPVIPLPEGNKYLGFIFARADTPQKVEKALRVAHTELRFSIR